MKIVNTTDPTSKPPIIMLLYGEGGVGKTTFASTAPKPLIADIEGGTKYFGLRGIDVDVAPIKVWADMKEYADILKTSDYETAVIDPIGELMEKLKTAMVGMKDSKLVQKDGSPTMAGWGWLKKTLRDYIKFLRDSGKHVILIAHVDEKEDENRMIKRPKIETKIAGEIVNMVDIVGYMTVIAEEGVEKRILMVDPSSDKFVAKDRTEQLGKVIPPNFSEIVKACQGTKTYKWSKPKKETADKKTAKPKAKSKEDDLVAVNHLDMDEKTDQKESVKDKLTKANKK